MISNLLALIILLITTHIFLSKILGVKENDALLATIIISFSLVYQFEPSLILVQASIAYGFFLLFIINKLTKLNSEEKLSWLNSVTKKQASLAILLFIINIIIWAIKSSVPTFSLVGFLLIIGTIITSFIYKLFIPNNKSI